MVALKWQQQQFNNRLWSCIFINMLIYSLNHIQDCEIILGVEVGVIITTLYRSSSHFSCSTLLGVHPQTASTICTQLQWMCAQPAPAWACICGAEMCTRLEAAWLLKLQLWLSLPWSIRDYTLIFCNSWKCFNVHTRVKQYWLGLQRTRTMVSRYRIWWMCIWVPLSITLKDNSTQWASG